MMKSENKNRNFQIYSAIDEAVLIFLSKTLEILQANTAKQFRMFGYSGMICWGLIYDISGVSSSFSFSWECLRKKML